MASVRVMCAKQKSNPAGANRAQLAVIYLRHLGAGMRIVTNALIFKMGVGMTDIDNILKHATLANHDLECSSMVILMVTTTGPEAHMAIAPKDTFTMNGAVDMMKTEMIKLMYECTHGMKPRE